MKIHPNIPVPLPGRTEKPKIRGNTSGTSFKEVLKETVSGSETIDSKAGVASVRQASPTSVVHLKPVDPRHVETVVSKVNTAMDSLTVYGGMLSSPSTTLDQLKPVVLRLQDDVDALSRILKEYDTDPELRQLAETTMVTAAVEVARFWRGDYHP